MKKLVYKYFGDVDALELIETAIPEVQDGLRGLVEMSRNESKEREIFAWN